MMTTKPLIILWWIKCCIPGQCRVLLFVMLLLILLMSLDKEETSCKAWQTVICDALKVNLLFPQRMSSVREILPAPPYTFIFSPA